MAAADGAGDGPEQVVGFVGLGAMGYPMAGHMARLPGRRCLVWNRTEAKAKQHAAEHGSTALARLEELAPAEVVVMCLPTSAEDSELAERIAPQLARGSCLVSCTSGEPGATRRLAQTLMERFGVHFVDCPVSGGPRGANAGTLTCMLGAETDEVAAKVRQVVLAFAKKLVRCGPAGSGHAVKAVNNALNCAHLLLGTEGLLALQRFGVDPAVALDAINGSSGRSLQTQERIPQEVLTRRFAYGFKLPLMAKDCRIASGVLTENLPGTSTLLGEAARTVQAAAAEEGADADYTRIVRLLERRVGAELGSAGGSAEGSGGGAQAAGEPEAKRPRAS